MSGTALPTAGRFRFVASDRTGRPRISLFALRGVHQTGSGSFLAVVGSGNPRHPRGLLHLRSGNPKDPNVTSTTTFTIGHIISGHIVCALDALAVLAAKFLPITGAGVFNTPRTSWRVDLWHEESPRTAGSWTLQVGGCEAVVDLR